MRNRVVQYLLLVLVCVLTVYAPLELTRVIVLSELILRLHPEIEVWQFILEIALIWVLYFTGMAIVWKSLKRR